MKTATKKKKKGELNTGIKCYTVQKCRDEAHKAMAAILTTISFFFSFFVFLNSKKFPESGLKVHGI